MDDKTFKVEVTKFIDGFSPDDFMAKTVPLSHDDYALVGRLLQAYCWADFNGRRVLDLLWAINETGTGEGASRLRDAQVIEHLGIEAKNLKVLPEVSESLVRVFEMLDMHKDRRHEVAHWAARKLDRLNSLLVLLKNKRENSRRGIDLEGKDEFTGFGVMPIPELKVECEKLFAQTDYLSKAVKLLSDYLDTVRPVAIAESD